MVFPVHHLGKYRPYGDNQRRQRNFVRYVFDGDLDGYGIDEDCDDDNPNVLIDCDLDGLNRDEDCDDTNPSMEPITMIVMEMDYLPKKIVRTMIQPRQVVIVMEMAFSSSKIVTTSMQLLVIYRYFRTILQLCPSCRALLENGDSYGSGFYWIRNAQDEPFEVYCDMRIEDGGWRLWVFWILPLLTLQEVNHLEVLSMVSMENLVFL